LKLKAFLNLYAERSQAVLGRLPQDAPLARVLHDAKPAITLARALLDKAELPHHPPQVVVLGPTQAGKSTVVNLLLNADVAGVSPLAGFTVHPQGFLHGLDPGDLSWVGDYFTGYRCCRISELPRDNHRCFALETVPRTQTCLPQCVIWDTPDFDSLRSPRYLPGVLRTAALADVLIIVVSKDKYADRAVWDMLTLLAPLEQPVLVCLNKAPSSGKEILLRSWQEKWRTLRPDPPPDIILLPYRTTDEPWSGVGEMLIAALEPMIRKGHAYRKRLESSTLKLIRHHWPHWCQPLRAELEAAQSWQRLVDTALNQALVFYRHDFLDHPLAYETFQRALAELLVLLEIPGVAQPMMAFRRVVTWPLRKLFGKGRRTCRDPNELVVLVRGVEHALLQLQQALLEQVQGQPLLGHWWHRLAERYRQIRPALLERFRDDALRYYQDFHAQVEEAAQELYRRLRAMPVTLNSLRAARASADAAGLALLLQTGGIGPHDFVLAPAVLSLTSWLSESALGKYMDRVAADLKRRQLQRVRELLYQRLAPHLMALPEQIGSESGFGIDISTPEDLESSIKEPRYGLRLF